MDMKIAPARLSGSLAAPPSKSHAHRLMTAMFLAGREIPEAMCTSDDLTATRRCLCALRSGETLDCGESGTTLRFLLPVASALGVNIGLTLLLGTAYFFATRALLDKRLNLE